MPKFGAAMMEELAYAPSNNGPAGCNGMLHFAQQNRKSVRKMPLSTRNIESIGRVNFAQSSEDILGDSNSINDISGIVQDTNHNIEDTSFVITIDQLNKIGKANRQES